MVAFEMIETYAALEQLCNKLQSSQELALDLEADSLHHYQEKVCLIQVSDRKNNWLIDPLQIHDLQPLATLLNDPERLVVLHGGDYDIRSLHRDFRIEIGQVFDTMVAAQFCGYSEFSLAALLKQHFQLELDKHFQKADWSKRPLSLEMASYAACDTAFLLQLADLLRARLQQLDRLEWVAEECQLLAGNRTAEQEAGPLFLKFKGAGRLQPRNLAALEQLLQLRDKQARKQDRPPFKILSSESILGLAELMPETRSELQQIKGLSPRLQDRYGEAILVALDRARRLPEQQLPHYPRSKKEVSAAVKSRLSKLKSWREQVCQRIELAPGLLAPNWLLEQIAVNKPVNMEQLAMVSGIRQWQLGLWGVDLLEAMTRGTAEV